MTRSPRLSAIVAIVAICTLPLFGCSHKDEAPAGTQPQRMPPPPPSQPQASQQSPQNQQPSPSPSAAPQAAPPAANAGAAPPPVVAPSPGQSSAPAPPAGQQVGTSGSATTGGELGVGDNDVSGVQVALLDVRRTSGDTVTVKWQYRNTNPTQTGVREMYGDEAARDAYLLDPVNKKKYMVLRDANNETIAEKHDSAQLGPGARVTTWAKFPAPPPDVTKITVAIPHVAPFEDVPIK